MTDPDWSLWRSFGAVVEEGSLSGAARRLGLTQPTIGRHVDALEQALGAVLFERTLSGLKPTETALRLYEPVAAARNALAEAAMIAAGADAGLSGSVRISASTVMSHYVLPPMLATLREEFPQVALELVPSDSAENLLLREADIAVRMFRPTQLELVTKRLGNSPICCCAHESYLARRGRPDEIGDIVGHDLVGLDRSTLILDAAAAIGVPVSRDDFVLRTDSQTAGWELLKAGLGIGFAQAGLVAATEGMVALLPQLKLASLEVWLTTHRELFTSRRVRAIYDRLGELVTHYLRGPGATGTEPQ